MGFVNVADPSGADEVKQLVFVDLLARKTTAPSIILIAAVRHVDESERAGGFSVWAMNALPIPFLSDALTTRCMKRISSRVGLSMP